MTRFSALRPGDSVALIAPASPFDPALYEKGSRILREAGYRVVPGESILKRHGYLAGTDMERVRDLSNAVLDPEIRAIICIRGGYGSGRLLPWILFPSFQKNPKIFVGHSDITFLHLALNSRAGWTTFHGPNVTGMAEDADRANCVLNALAGKCEYEWTFGPEQVLRPGAVKGQVIGGNLTCLAHLVGTPFLPDMSGALLLIEDCKEALYRLDRIVNHLKLAGILAGLGGILLGEFTNCAENSAICDMVMGHVNIYDFPVIHSLPFGHGRRNDLIPFGAPFLLDSHERVLRILENPVAS